MGRLKEFDQDKAIDGAVACFWVRGYEATSVRDLARHMGIGGASLYNAYGGKRALFLGSLERYSKLVVPQKLGELDRPGASLAEVRAYLDGLVQDLLSPEGRQGCLLVNSAIELAAHDDTVAAVVRGHHARLERCFTDALSTAIERHEVAAAVDPVGAARALVATSQGLMVVGKANPDAELLRAIVDNAFARLNRSYRNHHARHGHLYP